MNRVGKRANLRDADLREADLRGADLRGDGANLRDGLTCVRQPA